MSVLLLVLKLVFLRGLVLLATVVVQIASHAQQPPHIVYILADDLGYNDIGYRGNLTDVVTPRLDELALNGVKLEQFYTQLVCSPSRAAIMTGRYPYRYGLSHGFIAAGAPYGLPLSETTLAERLSDLGYYTAIVGKWHLGMSSWNYTPTYRGFDYHFGFYNGAINYWAHTHPEGKVSSPLDFHLGKEARTHAAPVTTLNGTSSHNISNYGPFVYARETVRLIESHAASKNSSTQPLFLFLTHQSTHEPLDAPLSYINRFKNTITDEHRRTFAGMALALDEAVGTVVDALVRVGFWNNTLLLFHSDNGGNLNAAGNNLPLRGGKFSLFEGGTRATAFISGPVVPKEVRGTSNRLLSHEVDVFPTLLSVANGGTLPHSVLDDSIDGVSQWNAWFMEGAMAARTDFIYNIDPCAFNGDNYANFSAIRKGDYKYIDALKSPADEWRPLPSALSDGENLIVVNVNESKGPWLFNVIEDPEERMNLLILKPSKARELKALLDSAAKQTHYPFNCKGQPGSNKVPENITCPNNIWTPWK